MLPALLCATAATAAADSLFPQSKLLLLLGPIRSKQPLLRLASRRWFSHTRRRGGPRSIMMMTSWWSAAVLRWLVGLCCAAALSRSANVAPLVAEPSQYWEGNDGAWSTFSLRLGSPEQVVRVLVSTAIPNTVAVSNTSCPQESDCASHRGDVFALNASTTWQDRGSFGLYPELNFTEVEEPAYFGLDSIQMGLTPSGMKLENQVLAAIESTDYYLGYLGINPQVTNWTTDFEQQSDSLFKTLSMKNIIPSYTYSYTAGAKYRFKGILGSLVFGGYDASRAKPEDFTFTMADDVSRDLVVAIQAVTTDFNKGAVLSSQAVLAYIDSTFPYFVLPLDVCEAFERQLGLEWNPELGPNGMYTLNETQHATLKTTKPNVTFALGNNLAGPSTNITLPYAAFDLQASPPLVNSTMNYFPLLRAANDSQITIGRAFLQEAMLVADYAHQNFSIWPCIWDETKASDIITLGSPDASTGNGEPPTAVQQQNDSPLRLELGVGLGLGIPLLAAVLIYLFIRNRRSRRSSSENSSIQELDTPHDSPPIHHSSSELESKTTTPGERYASTSRDSREVCESKAAREMKSTPQELPGTPVSSAVIDIHISPVSPSLLSPTSWPRRDSSTLPSRRSFV